VISLQRRFENHFRSLVLAAALAAPAMAYAGPMEDAILAEINFARMHPQEYARRLQAQPVTPWERALRQAGQDDNDPDAYAEAVAHLRAQAPLRPLRADGALASAALEHVELQGPAGEIGHDGPDGERFYERLRRHGLSETIAAENIAYGPPSPAEVVRALIIDSGVPSRGHRRNIFHASFQVVGVSCGPHRDYATMCVMDFGGTASGLRTAANDRARPAAEE
jgi:uncharacterized protein YkwD